MKEIIHDISRLLHRLPEASTVADELRSRQLSQEVERRREEEERALENAYPAFARSDPLLDKLRELSELKREIDTRIALLLAYSRHFVRPRPYQLAVLADATDLSVSGVRAISNKRHTREEVARNLRRSDIWDKVKLSVRPDLDESLAILAKHDPKGPA
jgi:hypothetical protein